MKDSSAANADGTSTSGEFVDQTLSVNEACNHLGKSRQAVHKLIRRKALLSFMRGGSRRIPKTELRRFLEQGDHPDAIKDPNK